MKRQDNHIDDPHMFRAGSCPCCTKCWIHIKWGRCVYGGPYEGYEEL